jgi:hypothetical protein
MRMFIWSVSLSHRTRNALNLCTVVLNLGPVVCAINLLFFLIL